MILSLLGWLQFYSIIAEGRRKKEEGRRKKEEGKYNYRNGFSN